MQNIGLRGVLIRSKSRSNNEFFLFEGAAALTYEFFFLRVQLHPLTSMGLGPCSSPLCHRPRARCCRPRVQVCHGYHPSSTFLPTIQGKGRPPPSLPYQRMRTAACAWSWPGSMAAPGRPAVERVVLLLQGRGGLPCRVAMCGEEEGRVK